MTPDFAVYDLCELKTDHVLDIIIHYNSKKIKAADNLAAQKKPFTVMFGDYDDQESVQCYLRKQKN
jgi:hypothetical protein